MLPADKLRKQLAFAVRSIQWSYAVFWSISSSTHQEVLEWSEGYYNENVRRRKKSRAMELKAYKFGHQRSKQLRLLYHSMVEGGGHADLQGGKKAMFSVLSPEDLTDAEWYYLVCMSYTFLPGQCLPGRALANGETIWLCDAQYSENIGFTRSLLARSASIQTIVCFPYLGGVIELGVAEWVGEDPNLIRHCKACLLDCSKPDCNEKFTLFPRNPDSDFDEDEPPMMASCYGSEPVTQSWDLINRGEGHDNANLTMELRSEEDMHYKRTLSTVVKGARRRHTNPYPHRSDFCSSFSRWNPRENVSLHRPETAQGVLKKILNIMPLMHCTSNYTAEGDHYNSEIIRRENEKFRVLRSMVPCVNQVDKESILNNTIRYLRELESKIGELESCVSSVDFDGGKTGEQTGLFEQISDNYNSVTTDNNENIWISKTKACRDRQDMGIGAGGGPDLKIKMRDRKVLIELRCFSREYIVADIMDAINNLHMDAFSVRTSTVGHVLNLNLKAKFRGEAIAPAAMIKRELRGIVRGR